jgi:peptidoglycan-N-acetylglucosamine deacetylase
MRSALLLILVLCYAAHGQDKNPWNGKKCAVVLTYDDALNVHLDNVIPTLDSLNLKGTFYISGYFPGCRNRLADWKRAGEKGHELANHTLFHPCTGKIPGRDWVKPDYDLSNYTMQRLLDELRMNNVLLESLDGKKTRTFAYPCGDTKIGDESYIDKIKNDFISARGVKSEMVKINKVDLFNVPAFGINGESGQELIALVRKAMEENALLVFLFHGVGGEHGLNVSLPAHRELLKYLKKFEREIWTAPFQDVTEYAREYTESK